ncbi:unnamed protein product [Brassica oleracea]
MGCFTVWILITQLVLARSSTRWPSLVCMQCLRPYIHGSLVESKVAVYYSNTYWGLAYSGSINPVEEANIDMSGSLKRRRTCSRCGGNDHNKVTCKMSI